MPRTFLDSDFVDTPQSSEAIPVKAPRTFTDADFTDDGVSSPKPLRTFSDADFAPGPKPASALDIVTALPRGVYQGVVRGLPEMAGKATQFAGSFLPEGMSEPVQEFGKAVSESSLVRGRLTPEELQKEKADAAARTGAENVLFEAGSMLGPSILPGGALTGVARVGLGVSKAAKAGQMALAATKANRALNIGAGGAAGVFGLSQAQSTRETALERSAALQAEGKTAEAQQMKEKAFGFAPIVTGAIEAAGEFFGTKYLGKLFGADKAEKLASLGIGGKWWKDLLRTAGVEVGTEIGQQVGEAGVEKYSGIRPEADLLAEGKSVILPTLILTAMTGGMAKLSGAAARRLEKKPPSPQGADLSLNEQASRDFTPEVNTTPASSQEDQDLLDLAAATLDGLEGRDVNEWTEADRGLHEVLSALPEGDTAAIRSALPGYVEIVKAARAKSPDAGLEPVAQAPAILVGAPVDLTKKPQPAAIPAAPAGAVEPATGAAPMAPQAEAAPISTDEAVDLLQPAEKVGPEAVLPFFEQSLTNRGIVPPSAVPPAAVEPRQGALDLRPPVSQPLPAPVPAGPALAAAPAQPALNLGQVTLPKSAPTVEKIKKGDLEVFRGLPEGTQDQPGGTTYFTTDKSFAETFHQGYAGTGKAEVRSETLAGKNIWDFRSPEDIKALEGVVPPNEMESLKRGDWGTVERYQAAIRSAGFDGFSMVESGALNVGVFNEERGGVPIGQKETEVLGRGTGQPLPGVDMAGGKVPPPAASPAIPVGERRSSSNQERRDTIDWLLAHGRASGKTYRISELMNLQLPQLRQLQVTEEDLMAEETAKEKAKMTARTQAQKPAKLKEPVEEPAPEELDSDYYASQIATAIMKDTAGKPVESPKEKPYGPKKAAKGTKEKKPKKYGPLKEVPAKMTVVEKTMRTLGLQEGLMTDDQVAKRAADPENPNQKWWANAAKARGLATQEEKLPGAAVVPEVPAEKLQPKVGQRIVKGDLLDEAGRKDEQAQVELVPEKKKRPSILEEKAIPEFTAEERARMKRAKAIQTRQGARAKAESTFAERFPEDSIIRYLLETGQKINLKSMKDLAEVTGEKKLPQGFVMRFLRKNPNTSAIDAIADSFYRRGMPEDYTYDASSKGPNDFADDLMEEWSRYGQRFTNQDKLTMAEREEADAFEEEEKTKEDEIDQQAAREIAAEQGISVEEALHQIAERDVVAPDESVPFQTKEVQYGPVRNLAGRKDTPVAAGETARGGAGTREGFSPRHRLAVVALKSTLRSTPGLSEKAQEKIDKVAPAHPPVSRQAEAEITALMAKIVGKSKSVFFVNSNGMFDGVKAVGNNVFVDANADNPLFKVFAHEFLHADNDIYQRILLDAVWNTVDRKKFKEWRDKRDSLQAAGGLPALSEAAAIEEFSADFLAGQMSDPKFWERLSKERRGLFERMATWIHEKLVALGVKVDPLGDYFTEPGAMAEAVRAAEDFVRARMENVPGVTGEDLALWKDGTGKRTAPLEGGFPDAGLPVPPGFPMFSPREQPPYAPDWAAIAAGQDAAHQMALRRTWTSSQSGKLDDVLRVWQDRNVDMLRTKQDIERSMGALNDEVNFRQKETLAISKVADRQAELKKQFEIPILELMALNNESIESVGEYLSNRHAEEYNDVIARRNPRFEGPGSGIATEDAQAYLEGLSPERRAGLEAIEEVIRAYSTSVESMMVDYGLVDQETINLWREMYPHYVPFQREGADEGEGPGNRTGKGMNIRGGESKVAHGSSLPITNVLANLFEKGRRTIMRGEKNRVGNAAYGAAVKYQNKDFWKAVNPERVSKRRFAALEAERAAIQEEIDAQGQVDLLEEDGAFTAENLKLAAKMDKVNKAIEIWHANRAELISEMAKLGVPAADVAEIFDEPKERYLNPYTKQTAWRVNSAVRDKPYVLATRFKGQDHFLFFNNRNPRALEMAKAMKNMDVEDLHFMLAAMSKYTRVFASLSTQWNVFFGPTNATRDVQEAMLNLTNTPLAGRQKDVLKMVPKAILGIYKDVRSRRAGEDADLNDPVVRYANEYRKNGGMTGFVTMLADAQKRAESLEKEFKKITEGKLKSIGRAVFDWVSDYNESLENGTRLAVYMTGRENGMSPEQSAALAKEITINFNRKGQIASQAGAMYAFFNAAVQGSAIMAKTLAGPAGKRILAGGLTFGVIQALALAAAGYKDDEPPDFVKQRNIVIPWGDKDKNYTMIPLPLGFAIIPSLGRMMTEQIIGGGKGAGKLATNLMGLMADTFIPTGSGGNPSSLAKFAVNTITPTVGRPVAALAMNEDYTGRPVFQDNYSFRERSPGYTRTKDSASAIAKIAAEAANFATGGTQNTPGTFSPTPDEIDFLVSQYAGGVGRETVKIAATATAIAKGEEILPYKVPLVGRFWGSASGSYAVKNRFYENLRESYEHKNEIEGLALRGENVTAYIEKNPIAPAFKMAMSFEGKIKKLKEAKEAMNSRGFHAHDKSLDQQIVTMMDMFNKQIDLLRGKK